MKELHTITLPRDKWDLVIQALRATAAHYGAEAEKIGRQSIYGAALVEESVQFRAVADDIDLDLSE